MRLRKVERMMYNALIREDNDMLHVALILGANPSVAFKGGMTPLHYAAQRGDVRMIELLVGNGANATLSDARGDTALHAAARLGHEGALSVLLWRTHAKTLIHQANMAGETPIALAQAQATTRDECSQFLDLMDLW